MKSFSEEQVRRLLDPVQLIEAIEHAFRESYKTAIIPQRMHLETESGVLLLMPCYDRARKALGVKLVSVLPQSASADGTVQATYLLLDPGSGRLRATMEANGLTAARTAATSAVATRLLAREDARTLGVFGTGRQARAHIELLRHVRKFLDFLVCGGDAGRAREFCRQLSSELGIEAHPVEARACASQADVICTCTTSRRPLFNGDWLRPGTHLNLVGAFQPDAREVDDTTVRRARIVVDTYEGALAEAGDLLIPMRKGLIPRSHIVADLCRLVSGTRQVRRTLEEITLFKSVGCALEDLVAAELVYQAGHK